MLQYDVVGRHLCPHGIRNNQCLIVATTTPAVAAKDGEVEKQYRYDSSVSPVSLETYGRMGPASMDALRKLARHPRPASHMSMLIMTAPISC